MAKNTGKDYEALTETIFQQLLTQDRVKGLEVKRDIVLQGTKSSHQIDVYWKFEAAGIEHIAIVQCKDWASSVKQEQLFCFSAVLNDLPGQPRGIFVTRTGYQEGAKNFAEASGIELFELREPTNEDWEGRLREIKIQLHAYMPSKENTTFNFDMQWVRDEIQRLGLSETTFSFAGNDGDLMLEDLNGHEVSTVYSITSGMFPKRFDEIPQRRETHQFSAPTFLRLPNHPIGRLKVESIECTISVTKIDETVRIVADDIVSVVLRNVQKDTTTWFDKELKPRPSESDEARE